MKSDQAHTSYGFLLIPGFSMVALSCAIDALRAANIETGTSDYSWSIISENEGSVLSSSGIGIQCKSLEELEHVDTIAVCGGDSSHSFLSMQIEHWLKMQARKSKVIGAISDGSFVVAACGLFNNCRSTIHWKCQSAYRERFPDLDIRASILEVDGNRFSCAGGTSSLDLMLNFLSESLNADTIGRIAENFFHDKIRDNKQLQPITSGYMYAERNTALSKALVIMASQLETPFPIIKIAEQLSISHRQLDRLFIRYLGKSPLRYYREMRLDRAASLLRQTDLSVNEIALGCGFQSSSHLSKHFKTRYKSKPLQHRFAK